MSFPSSVADSSGPSRSFQEGQHLPSFVPPQYGPPLSASSASSAPHRTTKATRAGHPNFEIFEWAPKYASCQRYFLDHAQHSGPVQVIAAFANILLPYQRSPPIHSSRPPQPDSANPSAGNSPALASAGLQPGGTSATSPNPPLPNPMPPYQPAPSVSLIPYIRRLTVCGIDSEGIFHGFFGDDWREGVGPFQEQERRNLLFAAKSGGWSNVKRDYDMGPLETVPWLRPSRWVAEEEVQSAETEWSAWLAFEDWMVGPRAPPGQRGATSSGDARSTGIPGVGGERGGSAEGVGYSMTGMDVSGEAAP